jgi:3-oxoacyl-[acyl-carrier-protein] synthase II
VRERALRRRVFVTGMGAVTPYGPGVDLMWNNFVEGRSGITALDAFDPFPYSTRIAGQVRGFRPGDFLSQKEISSSARCVQFALASARMAIEDARFPVKDTARIGVFVGTSIGTAEYWAQNHAVFLEKGIRRVHPVFPALSYSGVVATYLAVAFGIRGPAMCISSACTSGADAVGMACMHIHNGLIDSAIVGGTDAPLTPLLFAAFDRLGIMSRENFDPGRASRPFAAERDGFVMSEGAGICILEAENVANDRGAKPRAEIAGYAATSDGYHPFSPMPTGEEGGRAIRIALEQADISPERVDYLNAHAIGSRPNDPIEIAMIKNLFGERASSVPVSAIKSMVGHTMGASGAIQLISCVRAIQTSVVPPTINLAPGETPGGLDLVPDLGRKTKLRNAVSPTFGFGSRNAVLVLKNVCE